MRMVNNFLIALLAIISSTCFGYAKPIKEMSQKEKNLLFHDAMSQFSRDHAKAFREKYNMSIVLHGGGALRKHLKLAFSLKGQRTQEEIRELVLKCHKELIEDANQVDIFRMIDPVGDMTERNISLSLFIEDKNEVSYPYFDLIASDNSGIHYYGHHPSKDGEKGEKFEYHETFEEAMEKLNTSSQSFE